MCPDKENFVTKTKVFSFLACLKKTVLQNFNWPLHENKTEQKKQQPNEQVFVSTVSPLRKPTWLMYT